ncbi:MAG TPA: protein kinase [Gemmatimonas sp.]|nr:protein kinase [Gemmatimonas sp.]
MIDIADRLTAALADRYRVERELGAGGMATVYLAEDLRHDRKVAMKVLRPELAAVIGAERFLKEIKTTATLQHPHILGLLDSGNTDGLLWYVMPYVEGESLRDLLQREKQLPVPEAVRIASEVAGALHYAHRHGVIHRDIKPENILLHDGSALVADFGIALAASSAGTRMTETGMSLGTPHYMSPEQAMGEREITARSDVYALGCITYEMLTGDPPFTGSTAQAVVAKVLTERPRSLSVQRHTIPAHMNGAVLTALEKLPADRFASAAEFASALTDRSFTTSADAAIETVSVHGERRWRWIAATLGAALVMSVVVAAVGWLRGGKPGMVRRFYLTMSQYQADYGNPVISPDGARIVYTNMEGSLMVRRIDDLVAKAIPGSEAAWATVFSPDGGSIAVSTGFPGALKVIPLDGGPARTLIADSTYGTGLDWSDDGWLYYLHGADYGRDLMRVQATGGAAEFVARPDSVGNALFFYWPQALAGGKRIILTVYPRVGEPSIGVLDRAAGKVTMITAGIRARYLPTGHIAVVRSDGVLQVAKFDVANGVVVGSFTAVAEDIFSYSSNTAALAVSDDGTLVYQPFPPSGQVVRVWRDGAKEEPVDSEWGGTFNTLSVSPDGSTLAVGVTGGGRTELWAKSLTNRTFTKLSSGGTMNYRPSWSSDGREVVFTSDQNGKITMYRVPADGSGQPRRLLPTVAGSVDEGAFSADGRWVVFRGGSGGGRDVYGVSTLPDAVAKPLVAGPAEEFSPALSPDGRWLAYASDETGRTEVYVRPFPDVGAAKYPVSRNGGAEPLWSARGGELFYRNGAAQLVAVQVAPGEAFRVMAERPLFSTSDYTTDNRHRAYSVGADGRSFYFVRTRTMAAAPNQLVIVLNWFEELKRKVGQ